MTRPALFLKVLTPRRPRSFLTCSLDWNSTTLTYSSPSPPCELHSRYISLQLNRRQCTTVTTAHKHTFDAAWATGLWIFTDKGYQGAGPRLKILPKGNCLNPNDETIRETITDIPTKGENAALYHCKSLKDSSLYPTAITRKVMVPISLHHTLAGDPGEKTPR